ncbi:MAG TPA: patatin-like phospholipase family protein [Candidatus Dormibacteraeota bacterium]
MFDFGLVLGAGGGTGRAFNAGVLAALDDMLGIDARAARVVIGTSAGAVDGALVRAGIAPRDLFDRIATGQCSPAGAELFASIPDWEEPEEVGPPVPWRPSSPARLAALARRPWHVLPRTLGTVVAAVMPLGRRSTDVVEGALHPLHPERWPGLPLWVCAVRLDDGRRVVFGRDADVPDTTVGRAVAASCAMPGYFAPVDIGGARYVDGGMFSTTNADLLAGSGLDLVIITAPNTMVPGARGPSADAMFRSSCRILTRHEAVTVRRAGSAVLLLAPSADDVRAMGTVSDSMSSLHLAEVALQAYESTLRRLSHGPLADAVASVANRSRAALERSAS